jgi:peptide-methionine (S)-S-oxide reductase
MKRLDIPTAADALPGRAEKMPITQRRLSAERYGQITTEIVDAPELYYAEEYHQQYLSKNPGGYCGLGGTGVSCPTGLEVQT